MKKFEYLDHTSEAKFKAFGMSKAEAFSNACLATVGLMTKLESVKHVNKTSIRVESESEESLLYDLLDEIIYIVDVELTFISKIENPKITSTGNNFIFEADCYGDKASNCVKAGDVKAPTYDDMVIEERDGRWMVQVVVDV